MNQFTLDPTVATLIGTAIGALAGVGGTIAASFITKQSEERRHIRELTYNSALEEWKAAREVALRSANQGRSAITYGLDTYLLRMILINEFLKKENFTEANIASEWARMDGLIDRICGDVRNRHTQRQQRQSGNPSTGESERP
jgi:hypothetical protein